MRFVGKRRRHPPNVIIVSLIDVLMVVLIFMMVATTFKEHPALRLALPESSQSQTTGENPETLVVTIAKEQPYLYLGQIPVTFEKLESEMKARKDRNQKISIAIRADRDAPFGEVVRVMDAAKEAGIRMVNAFTQSPAAR